MTDTVVLPSASPAEEPSLGLRFARQWFWFFSNVGDLADRDLVRRWPHPDQARVQMRKDVAEAVGFITDASYVLWLCNFVDRRIQHGPPFRAMEIRHIANEMAVFNSGFPVRDLPRPIAVPFDRTAGVSFDLREDPAESKVQQPEEDSNASQARNIKESLEMVVDDLRKNVPFFDRILPRAKDKENAKAFGAVGRYLNEVLKMVGGGG